MDIITYNMIPDGAIKKLTLLIFLFITSVVLFNIIELFVDTGLLSMINVFLFMYVIYFLTDKIIMNSNRKICVMPKQEKVKFLVGLETYHTLNMKDITLIEKENNNYYVYFKKDTLKITTDKLMIGVPIDYQDVLKDCKIKLDSRFKEKDIIELKNILEQNHSDITSTNQERKIVPFEKHFSKNVYETISQKKLFISFFIVVYTTFNYFKIIELFTDNKLIIISSYIFINIIGYGTAYLILKKILKINSTHKLHFTNEDAKLYYLNKETNTEIFVDVMEIAYLREELNGNYVFVLNDGTFVPIDKRYNQDSIQKIFLAINKKNNLIQYY